MYYIKEKNSNKRFPFAFTSEQAAKMFANLHDMDNVEIIKIPRTSW